MVRKLILVGCPPFEERYVAQLTETRLKRLSKEERREFESLLVCLQQPKFEEKDAALARLGSLVSKSDVFDPIADEDPADDLLQTNGDIFKNVWEEAAGMRHSNRLLPLVGKITCPVVAIHGVYDPHPGEGVEKPLERVLRDFRFFSLKRCGHTPWMERQARDEFYEILIGELRSNENS